MDGQVCLKFVSLVQYGPIWPIWGVMDIVLKFEQLFPSMPLEVKILKFKIIGKSAFNVKKRLMPFTAICAIEPLI